MNRGSTLFLKFVIGLIALGALAICIYALPALAADDAARHPDLAWQQYPFLAYSYILCLAFFIALFQAFKLLTYIDNNRSFSDQSVRSLKIMKYCAITIIGMMVTAILVVMIMASGKGEDITGVIMMGLIVTFVAAVGATVVAVLQRHVEKAIELKSENDLTV